MPSSFSRSRATSSSWVLKVNVHVPRAGDDVVRHAATGLGVADRQRDLGAGVRQRAGRLDTDPGRRPGHDGATAFEIHSLEHLGGRRLSTELHRTMAAQMLATSTFEYQRLHRRNFPVAADSAASTQADARAPDAATTADIRPRR